MITIEKTIAERYRIHRSNDPVTDQVPMHSQLVDDKLIGDDFELYEAIEPVREEDKIENAKNNY